MYSKESIKAALKGFVNLFLQNLQLVYGNQGDQIGRFFCPLGFFWGLIMIFCKDEVGQWNGNILGYFLFKQICYILT